MGRNSYTLTVQRGFFPRICNEFSLMEFKVLLYCMFKTYSEGNIGGKCEFDFYEFHHIAGLKTDSHTDVRRILEKMADRRIIVKHNVVLFNDIVTAGHNTYFSLHKDMEAVFKVTDKPAVFNVKNLLLMKSKHSMRLYILIYDISDINKDRQQFAVVYKDGNQDDICFLLSDSGIVPSSWTEFKYFKRNVLKHAVDEINKLMDMDLTYTPKRETVSGKKTGSVSSIVFGVNM